jgi:hypothetical protein
VADPGEGPVVAELVGVSVGYGGRLAVVDVSLPVAA